jgi:filamentous hemagglutinin
LNLLHYFFLKTQAAFVPFGFSGLWQGGVFAASKANQGNLIGISAGKSKNSLSTDTTATTHTGSLIASNAGDVKLTAGNTLNIEGSDVLAANNATLVANNINIINTTDSYTQKSEQKAKSSGLTVALAGTVGDAANAAVSTVNQASAAKDRGNDRLAAAYETKAALTAVQAGQSLYTDLSQTALANQAAQTSAIGVSVSVGSSKSKSNSSTTQTATQGSNVSAGNSLTVIARGDGQKGADGFATNGDVNVVGSSLSGKEVNVSAARDINFASAVNQTTETSSNKSSGFNAGVNIGVSASGSMGVSVFANANKAKGNANGSSTSHTEAQVSATDKLTLNSGRDTNLIGAQVRGQAVEADVGRNLTITSLQDTSNYESTQRSQSAGVEVPVYGAGTASGSYSQTKQTIDSNYQSVNEQSGIYAGNGGFDVNVKGHTQLNGAVIASTAPAEFNQLATGSFGHTNIENQAEYEASSSGASIGGGSLLSSTLNLAASQIPSSLNQNGSSSSTTVSAISPATITVGGQTVEPVGLSRDPANAANALKPIFDLQEVQDNFAMGSAVADIAALTTNIIATEIQRPAAEARDKALAEAEKQIAKDNPALWASITSGSTKGDTDRILAELNKQASNNPAYLADITALGENPTEGQKQAVFDYHAAAGTFGAYFQANQAYIVAQKDFAPGGKYNMASQAISGLLASAAGGNLQQGLTNAAAPLLANQVGDYFDKLPDTDANNAARLVTHAAVGAAVAYLSGNDAASGAAGAVTGEALAQIIIEQKYDGKTSDQLSTAEKEDIRAISTIASALVGGVTGGSFEDAVTAGAAGYNAVTNNQYSVGPTACLSASTQSQCKAATMSPQQQREVAQFVIDGLPLVGSASSLYELFTGKSAVSEEEANRWLAGVGLAAGFIPGGKIGLKSLTAAIAKLTGKKTDDVARIINAQPGSKGSWNPDINANIKPKTSYVLDNGHKYSTDASARVTQVSGDLNLSKMDRNGYQQCKVGKCGNVGDQGGHLIAASLGGAGDKLNLVPMDKVLNNGPWKSMEKQLADALKAGKNVSIKIDVGYSGNSARPSEFRIRATIDGEIVPFRFFQ